MGTIRTLCSLLVPLWGLLLPLTGRPQSIDTDSSAATIGEPVAMTLQVRAFDVPPSRLVPDCFAVRLQHADSGDLLTPLQIVTRPSSLDGQVTLQILSPAIVREPILLRRIDLLCGAAFSREFTVLADPPRPGARPAPHRIPQARSAPSRVTPPPAPPVQAFDAAQERQASAELIARLILDQIQRSSPEPAQPPPPRDPQTDPLWLRLGEEQHQTRLMLTELRLKLEQNERSASRDAWLIAGTLIGLGSCLMIGRLLHEGAWRRLARPARNMRRTNRTAPPSPRGQTPLGIPPEIRTDLATPAEPQQDAPMRPLDWPHAQAAEEDRRCWIHSDFGQPALEDEDSQALLAALETPVEDSQADRLHQVMALERHLIGQPARCPWLLLRLLNLYAQLGQAGNHERVAAQLEALYNVQVPPLQADRPGGKTAPGRTLEQHERTWRQIDTIWPSPQAEPRLAALLVRPTLTEELDLPAFEELLTLHGVLRWRDRLPAAPVSAEASRWEIEMLAA